MFVRIKRLPIWPTEESNEGLLGDYFGDGNVNRVPETDYFPVDIAEYDNRFEVVGEMPGVTKDGVSIRVEEGCLSINADRQPTNSDEKDAKVLHSEIGTRRYTRSFRIPREVTVDKISAELSDGVLRLTLPKEETALPREINVR